MKSLRFMLAVTLLWLCTMAFAQTPAPKQTQPQSDAQKAFTLMKTLAGSWEGKPSVIPPLPGESDVPGLMQVSFRVTSRGNALVHEMTGKDSKPGPASTDQDDPITMFYVDGDRLLLTHFCDAGNRPRMVARLSPDGKTIEFDFLDISGKMLTHHMQHAVFTVIDANHHTEDWTFQMGDKPVHAHVELQRVKSQEALAR
ncbi:MAG TPA: hypothetical protein VE783_13120 [Candidatus Limnocylindrales bacterium]|jgi:hypothetical protein|nr:hypothetical protein [Candidatus Limnocylindrales bacterium]